MSRREKLPRVLEPEEQEALLDQLNRRYWTPHRDRTAVLTMLDAGLRVSEVCALKMDHVDLSRRKIKVRDGKGGVDRVVPMPPRLADALSDWMDRRPEALEEESEALFPTRKGKPVHTNQLRRSVKRAAERADLPELDRISPHTLRHTAAVDLLRDTGRLEIVQEFLGHADISTTRVYARLCNGELEEALSTFRADESEGDVQEEDDTDVEALADTISRLEPEAREALAAALAGGES